MCGRYRLQATSIFDSLQGRMRIETCQAKTDLAENENLYLETG
ncbi:MAG: hypothetical protein P8J33_07035 [Pirellulaceae bacterium]|nr:hypothetical protein [Pirellulaceae bacterium]